MSHNHAHDHEAGHGHDHDGHDHSHDGPGGHSHAPASYGAAFAIGTALNAGFVAAEVVYGFSANSLALLADAAHNLGDVLGLVLSWIAASLAMRTPTKTRTYGMGRGTILASLANAMILLVSIGSIGVEAIQRWMNPQPVAETTVIWVALVGIGVNGITALMFMSGRAHDLNVRSAFIHMMSDAAVSLGVVVAGILIGATGWLWLDPATSLGIAIIIAVGTWGLLRHAVGLAMDAVPPGIDPHAVEEYLRGLPGVHGLHDLHIWGLSTTSTALTVHLICERNRVDDQFLADTAKALKERFRIDHPTMQVETSDLANMCTLAPDQVV
jgi:cobalt-zinc-cadmium efflux system protein